MNLIKKCLALFSITVVFIGAPAFAQTPDIAPQPCDTNYWNQMSSRAWMEAEREIMQNQNLIFKPDSVLEYTCFDRFVNLTAHEVGKIFTHTEYFGEMIIPTSATEGLPKSLDTVVYKALTSYISGSFGHTFLGGRSQNLAADNQDFQGMSPSNPISGGYVCNTMANVWKAAKCSNFVDNSAFEKTDGFYPFESLASYNGSPPVEGYDSIQEVRQWPTSMSCGATSSGSPIVIGLEGSWDNYIAQSNNMNPTSGKEYYKFREPLAAIYKEVGEKLEPGVCTDAIATGVTVYPSFGGEYLDGVCTNPGCVYVRSTSKSLGVCLEAGSAASGVGP